jgi:IS5 family transposase
LHRQRRQSKRGRKREQTEYQANLTDDESRIMRGAGGGFEQCYNAQAAVDSESMRIVAPTLTQAANDKEQIAPALAAQALPDCFHPERLLADTGYFSASNVHACDAAKIEPWIAVDHYGHKQQRKRSRTRHRRRTRPRDAPTGRIGRLDSPKRGVRGTSARLLARTWACPPRHAAAGFVGVSRFAVGVSASST